MLPSLPGAVATARPERVRDTGPALDVVIPVYNEEAALRGSVLRLLESLDALPYTFQVTVADNASTDGTPAVATRLAAEHPEVVYRRMDQKGRGRALKGAWSTSAAEVLVYMDVDLSTDLKALLPLVAPLLSGHSDLAIGTRLARGSRTVRGPKREIISRGYNLLLRGTLRARFSDAQCGFKAIRAEVADELLPLVQDDAWFFDTELLVLAERSGLRIHEVPVDWVDDPDSRVDIASTVLDDLQGIRRLGTALLRGQVPLESVREQVGRTSDEAGSGRLPSQVGIFVLVGIMSTLAYGVLFLVFRQWGDAQTANAAALVCTAVANTAANRRWTFGVRGPGGVLRQHVQGLLVLGVGLVVTSGALRAIEPLLGGLHPTWARLFEVTVLTGANLLVTVMRFVAMRQWIFRRRRST